jgi:hypothetical protein
VVESASYVFRKTAPFTAEQDKLAAEVAQFERLTAWWDRTFRDEAGRFPRAFHTFPATEALEVQLEDCLEQWLAEKQLVPAGPVWEIAPDKDGSPYPGLYPYDARLARVFWS